MRTQILFLTVLLTFTLAVQGKDKKKKSPAQVPHDVIEVIGHIPSTSGTITGFFATQHYSSYYLYVEHQNGRNVTLIDVTKASQPVVLGDVAYPPTQDASASLLTVAGTAALITEQHSASAVIPASQTVRIMDFSDPQHPKVAREFAGVTTITRDDARGLIFLGNSEGTWILHKSFAEDPEVQKAYEDYVLYSH